MEAIDEDGTEESSEKVVEKPCECKHPHHTLGLQVLLKHRHHYQGLCVSVQTHGHCRTCVKGVSRKLSRGVLNYRCTLVCVIFLAMPPYFIYFMTPRPLFYSWMVAVSSARLAS